MCFGLPTNLLSVKRFVLKKKEGSEHGQTLDTVDKATEWQQMGSAKSLVLCKLEV